MANNTSFWNLLKGYKINIPLLQKDYNLGREQAMDKRNKLLSNIHHHLTRNKGLQLDFVYGSIEGDTFCPTHGQQQLTTLFLLHWYIALVENIGAVDSNLLDRFVYDGHTSSHEFCDALVHKQFDMPTQLPAGELANTIKNKYWYRNVWNNDTTIQSMLVMLDAIHLQFANTKKRYLWERLTQDEIITFEVLDLGKNGYFWTDQLYLKNNARGKQITPFEKLKAYLIQLIEQQYQGKEREYPTKGNISYANYFAYTIEREWTNLFWTLREDKTKIDNHFSTYMHFITQLLYLKENTAATTEDFTNSFEQYQQVYGNEQNLLCLFDSLPKLHDLIATEGQVNDETLNRFFSQLIDETTLSKDKVAEVMRAFCEK